MQGQIYEGFLSNNALKLQNIYDYKMFLSLLLYTTQFDLYIFCLC